MVDKLQGAAFQTVDGRVGLGEGTTAAVVEGVKTYGPTVVEGAK